MKPNCSLELAKFQTSLSLQKPHFNSNSSDYVVNTELFSSEPSKIGYHFRGQKYVIEDGFKFLYNFQIIVLISENYVKNQKQKALKCLTPLGIFLGKTEKEYISIMKEVVLEKLKEVGVAEECQNEEGVQKCFDSINSERLQIDTSEYKELLDIRYVKNLLNNRDIILLKLSMEFDQIKPSEKSSDIGNYEERSYGLLARNFAERSSIAGNPVYNFLLNLHGIIKEKCNHDLIKLEQYKSWLTKIGNLAVEWINNTNNKRGLLVIEQNTLPDEYVEKMRNIFYEFKPLIKDKDEKVYLEMREKEFDPVQEFCFSFLKELIDDIVDKGLLERCEMKECTNVFKPSNMGKKYCSEYCYRRAATLRNCRKSKEKVLNEIWKKYPKKKGKKDAKDYFMENILIGRGWKQDLKTALGNYIKYTKSKECKKKKSLKEWLFDWEDWL